MAPKLKVAKGKAAAAKTQASQAQPVELDDDSDDSKQAVASQRHPDGDNGTAAAPHRADSEAGSYDGDLFDAALLDEEELPTDDQPKDGKKNSGWRGPGGGYNALKSHNGQYYSGMAIGGSHTWNYQPGVWKETKQEPDLWEIDYKTNKVRNHKAPAGSGAPVGTEYHWYIVAHQYVKKIDANTYEVSLQAAESTYPTADPKHRIISQTHLTGSKYKLAHKNVNSKNWDVPTVKGQREREIYLLEDAKRRIEGLPPVLSGEKVKVDKKEKGQATLGSFFQASPAKKRKDGPPLIDGRNDPPKKITKMSGDSENR